MRLCLLIGAALGAGLGLVHNAAAYTIDGSLSDWGVAPFVQWKPASETAAWTVENNTNHKHDGIIDTSGFRESRDLEAMYFDSDSEYIYLAIVSSIPFDSRSVSPKPEDIALDLDNDGRYEFGLDLAYIQPTLTGAPVQKDVYSVSAWNNQDGADFQVLQGTVIGTYQIANRYLGDNFDEPGTVHDDTYVLEAQIARAVFGAAGNAVDWHVFLAKYECITDYIAVHGTASREPNPPQEIPEPASLALLSAALLGLARRLGRK